jgi:hypothetical protein
MCWSTPRLVEVLDPAERAAPHAPDAARIDAAEALLDLGCGKPRQSHEAEITFEDESETTRFQDV